MVLILSIGYEVIHDGYVLLKSSSGIRLRSACEFGFPWNAAVLGCSTWRSLNVFAFIVRYIWIAFVFAILDPGNEYYRLTDTLNVDCLLQYTSSTAFIDTR